MEFKHFSHTHGLVFHHTGSEVHCSGCKSSATGNVYACWKCNYFLHEQCFRATRSLNHPAHPTHPLTLVPYPTYPSSSIICHSCHLVGNGFSYCCSECEFDVHVHCAHLVTGTPTGSSHLTSLVVHDTHGHSFNNQVQNPIYPPPIQNNLFPNYVPSS
ncbi:hypothetical protein PHJA_001458000 [Phtheirospermum japonicum]|uniref:DC1 domain-containing protein n=1 Tax=Phtheirospermum japonicum TaxID=374723 RepID=A0A830BYB5_9LAMI|nr:hypothetical protein PHJA_001458000 [Phtheirospermum japonicum]